MVSCAVHLFPAVSEIVDCVEQAVESGTNVSTDTASTLFTVIALVVVIEADEHGLAVQELPPDCAIEGEANAGTAAMGSDTRAANASKQVGRRPLLDGPYRILRRARISPKLAS